MRVLITGGSGLLGATLSLTLSGQYEVTSTFLHHKYSAPTFESVRLDVTDTAEVRDLFLTFRPDVVIHCAAETRVDFCEVNEEQAFLVNYVGTEIVARAANESSSFLIFISTDSVFDGRRGNYGEEDTPTPINVYARSKLAGEQAVANETPNHLILRTNFYGWSPGPPGRSLVTWLYENLSQNRPITGFQDIRFSPLLANHLAELVNELLAIRATGILHLSSKDSITKYEFARQACVALGFPQELVLPGYSTEHELKASRPSNTSLNSSKASRIIGRPMPPVKLGISRLQSLKALASEVDKLKAGAEID